MQRDMVEWLILHDAELHSLLALADILVSSTYRDMCLAAHCCFPFMPSVLENLWTLSRDVCTGLLSWHWVVHWKASLATMSVFSSQLMQCSLHSILSYCLFLTLGAKHCDGHNCLSVCLSICSDISETAWPNFTKFSLFSEAIGSPLVTLHYLM